MRVAFVLAEFPIQNESFIRRELEGLADRGLEGAIFALHQGGGAAAGRLGEWPVAYRPAMASWGLWQAQLGWLCLRPLAYVCALAQIVACCWRRPRVLAAALHNFPAAAYFARLAQRERIGRIHAHFAYVPGIVGNVASRLSGAAFSFTAHAWDIYAEPTMLRQNAQAADCVVTCTAHNLGALERIAPSCRGKLHLCYHGVPLDRYKPNRARKAQPPLIVCIGRLVEKKGYRYIVSACEMLKRRRVAFQCVIAGDGPERRRLECMVRTRGLEREVRLVGRVSEEQVLELLGRASALVCPSVVARDRDQDGIPNVILEALACGAPVVASRLSGIPEVIEHDVTGLLVEPGDADGLARQIERLLTNPAVARGLGLGGRDRVERDFGADANAAKLAKLVYAERKRPVDFSGYERAKRAFDVVAAATMLALLSPAMALIAVLVKLDSAGPVLFSHDRIGKRGRKFRLLKFRTMRPGSQPYHRTPSDDHDPRLTRFGRLLRNHGLDELPQLINVLRGEMSLVGPRPEMPFIVERYTEEQRRRLSVMPGITGAWQVDGPHDAPIHEHIEYDLDYLERRSFGLDLCLMLRTVPILFGQPRKRRHANRGVG